MFYINQSNVIGCRLASGPIYKLASTQAELFVDHTEADPPLRC